MRRNCNDEDSCRLLKCALEPSSDVTKAAEEACGLSITNFTRYLEIWL